MRFELTKGLVLALAIAAGGLSVSACNRGADPAVLAANDKAAKDFLEKNAKAEGVVTLPSGVQYKVLKAGAATGQSPKLIDTVKVHYEGKLIDGKIFDSSYERGTPAVFGLQNLVPAWQEALPKMKPGDVWELYVPPAMGYGEMGAGEIPPNSVLIFKIELVDFRPAKR